MGFFNCCALLGHSGIFSSVLGTAGVCVFASGASGFWGGAIGGGSGASCSYSNLFAS